MNNSFCDQLCLPFWYSAKQEKPKIEMQSNLVLSKVLKKINKLNLSVHLLLISLLLKKKLFQAEVGQLSAESKLCLFFFLYNQIEMIL